jgi:hypothetical protein
MLGGGDGAPELRLSAESGASVAHSARVSTAGPWSRDAHLVRVDEERLRQDFERVATMIRGVLAARLGGSPRGRDVPPGVRASCRAAHGEVIRYRGGECMEGKALLEIRYCSN